MFRVAILASTEAFCNELCSRVERSALGGVVQRSSDLLRSKRESVLRKIAEATVDVAIVEIPPNDSPAGIETIRDLQANLDHVAIFAVGELSTPKVIVAAMQSGACEFLDRDAAGPGVLLEAFGRLVSKKGKGGQRSRGQILAVMNAKGGCGATTVALNTGLALRSHGSVILVDLATLGNLAVHLNVQPTFGVRETLQNLYRLDATLLAGFVTQTNMDVHLLAGNSLPSEITASEDTFAQLFTLLATLYDYVVVDLSTRFDGITRILAQLADDLLLVSQTDVTSLWTASRVKAYIGTGPANANKVQLILNRVSGTLKGKENVIERQTGCKIRWKIPNQYSAIATAIESGAPVVQVGNSEVARSYAGLAAELAHEREVCGPLPSLFVPEPQSLAKRLFTRFLTPELSTGRTV